jgi:hypothetical protein
MRDTIEMAGEVWQSGTGRYTGTASIGELKRFEALVRADERSIEREACAKVCDDRAFQFRSESPFFVEMHGLAGAIRARGETK